MVIPNIVAFRFHTGMDWFGSGGFWNNTIMMLVNSSVATDGFSAMMVEQCVVSEMEVRQRMCR
jgi:hypothetical protein